MGMSNNSSVGLNGTRRMTMTINIAIREKKRFTNPERILESGKRYLGIYTFLIREALERIEFNAVVVDSELNENIKDPDR